ncbi:MAG: protein translocase subunit SecD, partial [Spirochaetia bacterium]|nr:protein translocase subunit SecD [Spirochaetia bacterium]
ILGAKFVTSARVNEMAQAHPELIDELRTELLPHPIEKALGRFSKHGWKNLKVHLGLDLQGGMRAVFRADFDTYLSRLKERYEPVLAKLHETVQKSQGADKESAQNRIDNIKQLLLLNENRKEELLSQAKQVIDKRLAAQDLTEPEVRVQPESYTINVDMPGVANSSDVLNKIKDTVTVEYRLVNDEATARLNNVQFEEEMNRIQTLHRESHVDQFEVKEILDKVAKKAELKPSDGKVFLYWRRGRNANSPNMPREFRVLGPVILDGNDMTDARENVNPNSAWYMINFQLSGAGADKFGEVTTKNTGKRLAILWGDRVVSDPVIRSPILGGSGVVEGDFSREQAHEVANVIREGALPLPLEILSVSFVGPSLGQESIVAGIISVFLGFAIVVFFMVGYYRLTGFVAVLALFLNLLIMAAILSALEFTLTLPGFAGVILTVGMAVDANVIIFEKMKEDLRDGKSPYVAIEKGFEASFWTILDSNVTTLIAAVVLYKKGDGPIQGFAVVLFWGLVSSMFTALYVSRLTMDWVGHFIPLRTLSIGWGFKKKEEARV